MHARQAGTASWAPKQAQGRRGFSPAAREIVISEGALFVKAGTEGFRRLLRDRVAAGAVGRTRRTALGPGQEGQGGQGRPQAARRGSLDGPEEARRHNG